MTSSVRATEGASSASARWFERAKAVLPGGVSRNTVLRAPFPLYARSGRGCVVTDVDGVDRLDFANNMASLIHGHAHPAIVDAVARQLTAGTAFTLATGVEVELAEHLCSRNRAFEQLRFVSSGTEAVMAAVKAARAFTGRSKIAKLEGAYHGGYDVVEVSQSPAPTEWGPADRPVSVPLVTGTPTSLLAGVVVIPFNDPERAVRILDEHRGEVAGVVLDLMPHRVGLHPADAAFVAALRDWTRRDGALLVLDEVITFRTTFGGAQSAYDVEADLTALGKIIGGGFPVGAVAGPRAIMDVMNPSSDRFGMPQSGTFSANPITMTAGLEAMRLYDHAAVRRVNELASRARSGLEGLIAEHGYPASVVGAGSMFRCHMRPVAPRGYRDAYPSAEASALQRRFVDALLELGIICISPGTFALSTATSDSHVDRLLDAVARAFGRLWP